MRMPRRRRRLLGPHRKRDFQGAQYEKARQPVLRREEHSNPQGLQDHNAEGVAPRRRATLRIRGRRAEPLHDQREPHDHIAADRGDVGRSRFEHGGDAGGHQQRACNLDEHQQPIRHVVAVVRGCEPRECHPCPPDGEEHHQVTDQALGHVEFGHCVMKPCCRLRDGHHEDQIEEELEWCGHAMHLVRRPRHHPSAPPRAHRLRRGNHLVFSHPIRILPSYPTTQPPSHPVPLLTLPLGKG